MKTPLLGSSRITHRSRSLSYWKLARRRPEGHALRRRWACELEELEAGQVDHADPIRA